MNWHSLSVVDYDVICERCQKEYKFPQADLQKKNGNWSYRVIGPFAVPDYARGSYGALLALKALANLDHGQDRISYSTALNMKFDGHDAEADFVALRAPERHGFHLDPEIIIGESKSFGAGQLITKKDLIKLKLIGTKLPSAIIVISVLRNHFIPEEQKLLVPFVRWGRRPDREGQPSNPIILLTGHELFSKMDIGMTWKELGGVHGQFEDWQHRRSIQTFAEATQHIYLGLPSTSDELHEKWAKKALIAPKT